MTNAPTVTAADNAAAATTCPTTKTLSVRFCKFSRSESDTLKNSQIYLNKSFLFNKSKTILSSEYLIIDNGKFRFKNNFDSNSFNKNSNKNFTVTINKKNQIIISKLLEKSISLSELFNTTSGIKEYQVGKGKPNQTIEEVKNRTFNSNSKINETYLPELRGKNLAKYSFKWQNEYISYGIWLAEPRLKTFFEGDKILIRQIPGKKSLIASYVSETFVIDQTAYIAKPKVDLEILFYLN